LFCLKILFNVNGKATVWHTPSFCVMTFDWLWSPLYCFVSQPLIGCQDLGIVLCHDLWLGVKTFDDAASLTPTLNLWFSTTNVFGRPCEELFCIVCNIIRHSTKGKIFMCSIMCSIVSNCNEEQISDLISILDVNCRI
jgi:hypothetical protein